MLLLPPYETKEESPKKNQGGACRHLLGSSPTSMLPPPHPAPCSSKRTNGPWGTMDTKSPPVDCSPAPTSPPAAFPRATQWWRGRRERAPTHPSPDLEAQPFPWTQTPAAGAACSCRTSYAVSAAAPPHGISSSSSSTLLRGAAEGGAASSSTTCVLLC